jgi:23S rRNA (uracil1939-C5)-methyltransferase
VDAPDGFEVTQGKVEEQLADLLPTDLLIVNPPRAGLHEDVPVVINATPPARVIYVSCDPATLARDLRALGEVYDLVGLHCFDLFPQTSHVETVALLSRREQVE